MLPAIQLKIMLEWHYFDYLPLIYDGLKLLLLPLLEALLYLVVVL